MSIDRKRFLELTLLLGASCTPRPAPQEPAEARLVESAPATYASSSTPVVATGPETGASCNDRGTLDACLRIGPTCEGLASACRNLGQSLRPKVAEAWSLCFAAQKGNCHGPELHACMRKAIDEGCADPRAEAYCEKQMKSCTSAGRTPRYTLETCARVVSAVRGEEGSPEWEEASFDMLGPSAESGSCALDYTLPFQPYNPVATTPRPTSAPPGTPFDKSAAMMALASVSLASCNVGNAHGHITITFSTDGTPSMASVDSGPLVSTPAGGCVAGRFRSIRVPPFSGSPVKVGKSF